MEGQSKIHTSKFIKRISKILVPCVFETVDQSVLFFHVKQNHRHGSTALPY